MSPQPAAPARNTAPDAPQAAPDAPSTPAQRQIARAKALEKERAELQVRITKNRDYLRLMASNEELTDDESKWLATFYPVKEKGDRRSADEIEATRKIREAARK